MFDHRRFPRALLPSKLVFAYATALLIAAALVSLNACSKSVRTDTIHANIIAVDAARTGFAAWDRDHQHQLVETAASRDAGIMALASYRDKRATVVDAFVVAYQALATAATVSDDPSLIGALAAASRVIATVKALTEPGGSATAGDPAAPPGGAP